MEVGGKGARPWEEGESLGSRLTTICGLSIQHKFTSPLVFTALWTSIYIPLVKRKRGTWGMGTQGDVREGRRMPFEEEESDDKPVLRATVTMCSCDRLPLVLGADGRF